MSIPAQGLILVVDDNEVGRYTKSRILRDAGYDVIEGSTGDDALRLITELSPRLVLLDVNLPGVDGWEVCRRLKANPDTASVAVLQVSATHVREEDTVRALEGGADASLTEPIEPAVLVATVRALLRARLAEDALRDALAREQVVRAAAEAANRTKDEFLATLSHELRSPLGVILTWVALLRSGRIDDAGRARGLEAIERNTRHQAKLIEDLLDVSPDHLRQDAARRRGGEPDGGGRRRARRRAPCGGREGHPSRLQPRRRRSDRCPATPPGSSRWSGTCSPTP